MYEQPAFTRPGGSNESVQAWSFISFMFQLASSSLITKFESYEYAETRIVFFEALPQQTLTNIENDAAAGRVETKWTRKANASADGGVLDSTNDKTVNAVSWIENDIGDLAEE